MLNRHIAFFYPCMLVGIACLSMACDSQLLAREQQRTATTSTPSTAHYVAGQVLIWTNKTSDNKALLQWIKQRGDQVLSHIPEQRFYQIKVQQHEQEAIQAYKKRPNIVGAELNYIRKRR